MPRGVKKSELEKLREELSDVQDAIAQYQAALKTMKEKEKDLQTVIEQEEVKEVIKMLKERGLGISDIKTFIDDMTAEIQETA